MPRLLSFLLLLLPALAAGQTSRVQGFSVSRDQRESYILEVILSCSNFSQFFSYIRKMLTFLLQPFCFLPDGVLHMRVRDISFHDLQEQGSDLDKKMDFPLALMKTAQAVIQDGHKLFRFGSPLRPKTLTHCHRFKKIAASVASRVISAIKYFL